MIVALSNLILLIPVACVLAIILSMTGSTVLRPRNDAIRIFVLIVIWQFVVLGMIGLLARSTWFSLVWVLVMLVFLIQLWFWERGVARSILLLVLGTNAHSEHQLKRLLHFLRHEGRGYWRRLGSRFERNWLATGNWQLAMVRARIARPARARLALAQLATQHDTGVFQQQLAQTVQEQKQVSLWLGRLTAASLAVLALLVGGLLYQFVLGPTFARMWQEFDNRDMNQQPSHQPWTHVLNWNLHILFPVITWMLLLAMVIVHKFPRLARHRPMVWLFGPYYRALALSGLAEQLRFQRDPGQACQLVAQGLPVPRWSQRLERVTRQLAEGFSVPSALTRSGLLRRSEAKNLALCQDPDTLAWAMRELSTSLLQRALNRTHLCVQVLTVALTLTAGVLSCLYAVAIFGSLAGLIEWLA